MLGRGAANITDSQRKLEEIERQLKLKLERAREITSQGSLDEHTDKTQQELIHDLEVHIPLHRKSISPSLTPHSTTPTSTGRPTCKTKSTAPSFARPMRRRPHSKSSYLKQRYA